VKTKRLPSGLAFVYPIRVFQNEKPRTKRARRDSLEHREERASREDASSLAYGRCRRIEFAAAEATRSSAVGDEFEHRLQLLLSVVDPLEHGAGKGHRLDHLDQPLL
jgi:hypothetical protein